MFDFLDEILPIIAIIFLVACHPLVTGVPIVVIFLLCYIVHVIKK
nr:MAG TPA: hypothetical protein [Caudoviricetes sp.]